MQGYKIVEVSDISDIFRTFIGHPRAGYGMLKNAAGKGVAYQLTNKRLIIDQSRQKDATKTPSNQRTRNKFEKEKSQTNDK